MVTFCLISQFIQKLAGKPFIGDLLEDPKNLGQEDKEMFIEHLET